MKPASKRSRCRSPIRRPARESSVHHRGEVHPRQRVAAGRAADHHHHDANGERHLRVALTFHHSWRDRGRRWWRDAGVLADRRRARRDGAGHNELGHPGVQLRAGTTTISVTAHDALEKTSTTTLTVTMARCVPRTCWPKARPAVFDLDILLANPNGTPVAVTLTFLKEGGSTRGADVDAAGHVTHDGARRRDPRARGRGCSTIVTSVALPLVVERTMRWDASGYGAHTEKATSRRARSGSSRKARRASSRPTCCWRIRRRRRTVATIEFLREGGRRSRARTDLAPLSRSRWMRARMRSCVNTRSAW